MLDLIVYGDLLMLTIMELTAMPLTYHDIRYGAPRNKPVPKALHILQVLKFDCAQGQRELDSGARR